MIEIFLKCVTKYPIHNIPSLVWIMTLHRIGNKPYSESMMAEFTYAHCNISDCGGMDIDMCNIFQSTHDNYCCVDISLTWNGSWSLLKWKLIWIAYDAHHTQTEPMSCIIYQERWCGDFYLPNLCFCRILLLLVGKISDLMMAGATSGLHQDGLKWKLQKGQKGLFLAGGALWRQKIKSSIFWQPWIKFPPLFIFFWLKKG